MMTTRLFAFGAAVALLLCVGARPAHAELVELDRETAKQYLAESTGVVLVDVYAYW